MCMYAKHLASTHYRCNKFKRNNQGCLFRKSRRSRQRLRFIVVHHSRTKRQQIRPPSNEIPRLPIPQHLCPVSPLSKNHNSGLETRALVCLSKPKIFLPRGWSERAPCRSAKWPPTSPFAPALALLLSAAWVLYRHIGSLI